MKSSSVDRRIRAAVLFSLQPLEARCLLSAAVVSQIPNQSVLDTGSATLNLPTFLADTAIGAGDTVVNVQTNLPSPNNSIPLELTNAATPGTVANFLKYISTGEYNNIIIHRSIPGFIIQGGGYTAGSAAHIPTFGTIPGEASTATLKNTTGTIAMALSSGPDSGTSEWFFNLANNDGSTAGNPNLDDTSDGGPFTAFGKVIYNGLTVADAIAALPTVNDTDGGTAWSDLPVQNMAVANGTTVTAVPAADFVTLTPVVVPGGTTYTAVSSDPSILTVSIANGVLTLTPVAGATVGSTTVTVTATDLNGGTASSTFTTRVTNNHLTIGQQPADAPVGATLAPVVVDIDTAANTIDTSDNSNVTLSLSGGALGGTTTVAAVGGVATFSDLTIGSPGTYTLSASSQSALPVTSDAIDITPVVVVGAGGAKSVSYVDADGTLATVTVRGPGTATVDFSGTGITQSGVAKVLISGTGTAITSITTTGTTAASVLAITTLRGTHSISIGNITTSTLHAITAPGVTVNGNLVSSGSIGTVSLASASGGTIFAGSIGTLATAGVFADALTLTGGGVVLGKFKAGAITAGSWNITGGINAITAGAIAGWDPIITQSIKALVVNKGDVSNITIVAAALGMVRVKGSLSNSTLQLTGAGSDLRSFNVGGSIAASEINAAGSLGNIAAASLVNSQIYAGVVNLTVGEVLPTSPTDFTQESIVAVKLRNIAGITSFSNSVIAASVIGNLSLGTLLTNNNGNPTGVVAQQGIRLVTGIANKKFALRNVANANVAAQIAAQGVVLGDFHVDVDLVSSAVLL